jgi:hypothetical protein
MGGTEEMGGRMDRHTNLSRAYSPGVYFLLVIQVASSLTHRVIPYQ